MKPTNTETADHPAGIRFEDFVNSAIAGSAALAITIELLWRQAAIRSFQGSGNFLRPAP